MSLFCRISEFPFPEALALGVIATSAAYSTQSSVKVVSGCVAALLFSYRISCVQKNFSWLHQALLEKAKTFEDSSKDVKSMGEVIDALRKSVAVQNEKLAISSKAFEKTHKDLQDQQLQLATLTNAVTKLSNKKSLQEQESITSLFDELRAYLEKNHKQSLAEHEFEQECLTGLQEQLNAFSQGCSELLEKQYNAIVHQCEVQEKPRQDSLGALKLEKDQLQESIQQLTLRTEKVIQDQWIIIQHLQAQLEKYKHTSSTK